MDKARLRELEIECERAETCFCKRLTDFEKFLANTRKKKKPGRPGVWKSSLGLKFLWAVSEYQEKHACGPSRALRAVTKRQEFKELRKSAHPRGQVPRGEAILE